ncbi:phosphoribosyltransferase [Oscillatoria sp. FACHB-1406]|uniref:phosphoribosyltransferase n=1 Tax=Oscillatoria sp. FACHB-1406 TaxID=2692846 RepID=UPI0016824CEB|nr:phosphoribosyltransferase [Oscillatoria sp. FACHB-1406]MBD2580526.1 phosphoribosyltransferase [Oscillatoria sp. FACHB-1406]
MPELYISWEEYHQKIETLALQIHQSGWEFDQIVCLAKGGLQVGDILCRLYDKPLAILFASSYSGEGNRTRGEVVFSKHLTMTAERLQGRILLVDDLVDSGKSLHAAIEWLKTRYGSGISEIRTATIWYKSCSTIAPDYYVDYCPDAPWIHQPFERYELMTPAQLAALKEKS